MAAVFVRWHHDSVCKNNSLITFSFRVQLYSKKAYKQEQKRVGMAVLKRYETRCRDGSVPASAYMYVQEYTTNTPNPTFLVPHHFSGHAVGFLGTAWGN